METETGMVLAAFVLIANVLGAGMIVPQVLHLRRRGTTAGVSPTWIGIGLAMNLWWLSYGTAQSLWGMLPVSIVAAALYAVIAADLHRLDGAATLHLVFRGAAAIAVVPLLFLLVGGWASAGLAIGLIYAIQFAPATVAALRTDDVSGVARATWVMALGEAIIWFVYGWSRGDVALTIGGAGGSVMSALILLRVAQLSHRDAPVSARRRVEVVGGPLDELRSRIEFGGDDDPDWPLVSSPVGVGPRPR